jgi:hypothetical protein
MKDRIKVSFPTKILSNRHYLNEVPVEGKVTSKFNFMIGWYDLYAAQIIRTGNCITLLSNPYSITVDSFWNINYFEDIAKYIFWTFNKSFRLKLIQQVPVLSYTVLRHCLQLLTENYLPYDNARLSEADEELQFCFLKDKSLRESKKYEDMYRLDQENREAIKLALEERAITPTLPEPDSLVQGASSAPTLLDMIVPTNGSSLETLQFIKDKLLEAEFRFDIFAPVKKSKDNRNPHGFNGCIAAMIDFFYQRNYFVQAYSLDQVFEAYFIYSGNSIAKFSSFLSEFRQDNSFIKYSDRLNKLKINKLK